MLSQETLRWILSLQYSLSDAYRLFKHRRCLCFELYFRGYFFCVWTSSLSYQSVITITILLVRLTITIDNILMPRYSLAWPDRFFRFSLWRRKRSGELPLAVLCRESPDCWLATAWSVSKIRSRRNLQPYIIFCHSCISEVCQHQSKYRLPISGQSTIAKIWRYSANGTSPDLFCHTEPRKMVWPREAMLLHTTCT